MDKSLVYQLTGKFFPEIPACLENFKKLNSHFGYPYIIPDKDSKVEGILIKNVDPESLKKLDRYEVEGQLYTRRSVGVISGGERATCETYVGNPKSLRPHS